MICTSDIKLYKILQATGTISQSYAQLFLIHHSTILNRETQNAAVLIKRTRQAANYS